VSSIVSRRRVRVNGRELCLRNSVTVWLSWAVTTLCAEHLISHTTFDAIRALPSPPDALVRSALIAADECVPRVPRVDFS
jgi:hypothetical protein